MKSLLPLLLLPALVAAAPASPSAESRLAPVRRFALLVGANDGGPARAHLRYAASDAQAFGRVLEELGGVQPSDKLVLLDVDRAALLRGLERFKAMVAEAKAAGGRTEALIYYSGHSDEEGLLLRADRFGYRELRQALEALPADVRIAVLDSCASGTLARQKGGMRRPAFLVDASATVHGHAILTSSSEDEVSQESERIGGSYFTHNLISGLRGAADATGDGRVTLHEAYQFAFHETLARTEKTLAGAQHPAYEIDLAGTGDLVMTDLRSTAAGLVLDEPLDGHLFVRNDAGQLVVELNKLAGRATELGLQPGHYSVMRERRGANSTAELMLKEGGRAVLAEQHFTSVAGELTATRGGGPVPVTEEAAPSRQHRFFNAALVPSAQTNDMLGGPVDNNLSFALGLSRSARIDGVALGLGGTWATDAVNGVQLAMGVNAAGGSMHGAQLAVGGNWVSGDMLGVQSAAGLNVAAGAVRGMQMAVGVNVLSESLVGAQLAAGVNWAHGDVVGVQASASANVTRGTVRGVQASSGLSYAGEARGLQLSVLNVGGDVSGAQVGLVNIAGKMRGLQLGVINVSDDIDGAPIGLLSFSRHGQFHVEFLANDVTVANVGVKLGGRTVYTVFTGGLGKYGDARYWTAGMGLGVHATFGESFFLDTDVVGSNVRTFGEGWNYVRLLGQLRLMGGWQLDHVALLLGPSLNVMVALDDRELGQVSPFARPVAGTRQAAVWPGVQAGWRF